MVNTLNVNSCMCNAAAISNISRNGKFSRPTTKKDLKEGNRGMFHDFTEELRLTAVMAEMDKNTVTHQSNNQSLELQCERRREKEELKQELGLENAQDD